MRTPCSRCGSSRFQLRSVEIGNVTYLLCGICVAKINHPARTRDYVEPGQVVKGLARTVRHFDATARRWSRA